MIGRVVNIIGIVVLLGALLASLVHVGRRSAASLDPDRITIRLCHWQLEAGMREAFDAVAKAYEQRHPNVDVVQIPVPGRIYGTYSRTQLTGGSPPDIMASGAMPDARLTEYFVPLTRWVEQPNPYNDGTPLEGIPWRDTFVDGMATVPGLDSLQEYYSIGPTMVTIRMQINLDLYQQIMGHDRPPRTLEQFLNVCQRTRTFAERTGRDLAPVAGSQFNANILLDRLFRSQTQKLGLECDPYRSLSPPNFATELLFTGRVSLHDPEVRAGLELMHEIASTMRPGFMQFDRKDAILQFVQGRALMITTGSWDFRSLVDQVPFDVAVIPIPLPQRSHPAYGQFVLGQFSEAGLGTGPRLHVTADSAHHDVAVDFLQFLISYEGIRLFVDRNHWLPGIIDTPTPESVADFKPITEGYPQGFAITPLMWGSGEVYRVFGKHTHLLFNAEAGVEAFVRAVETELDAAVRYDVERDLRTTRDNLRRQDSLLAALDRPAEHDPEQRARAERMQETQRMQEVRYHWLDRMLHAPSPEDRQP